MKDFLTYKFNLIDGKYWYQPSIFTISRYKWAGRPFNNLEELVDELGFQYYAAFLNINGDPLFKTFNKLQRILKTNISINSSSIKAKGNSLVFQILPKVQVLFDDTSIKCLKKGQIFAWPLKVFEVEAFRTKPQEDEIVQFVYRKFQFVATKIKKPEDD